ncbi:hypothetical protein EST38_g2064 [Candolleomyces aberdarensis]|uniref:Uncharacterized protein n=1 Tax=Candolleomyces aberdarensis TaxID=2316362 RepID=A0A4Q2DTV2_9AGAR|nr:hypothetical protein EST38_g2064 [Candolleomyces aberdarensis]
MSILTEHHAVQAQVALTCGDPNEKGSNTTTSFSPLRRRRSSVSSSTSLSSRWPDSSSTSASSQSGRSVLEDDQIRSIFKSLKNVTIADHGLEELAPSTKELKRSPPPKPKRLSSEDRLNPTAVPFVPGASPTQQDFEVISTHSPYNAGGDYMPPPGLPPPEVLPHNPVEGAVTTVQLEHPSHLPPPDYAPCDQPPPWSNAFASGINPAIDVQIREFHAHAAVTSNPKWTEDELAFLASQISTHAYFATEDPEHTTAQFALFILQALQTTHGEMLAQSFLWNLRQHAMQAFMTSWDPASLDPAHHHPAQLSAHVISAISLARFIGDLFSHGLLPQTHVMNCISKIMETTFSEEHIVALGYLARRSGPELWMAFESLERKPDFAKAGNFLRQYEEASVSNLILAGLIY